MKNLFRTFFLVAVISSLTITSCSKYEEGPGLTVRTAKARISRTWNMTSYTVNGTDQSSGSSLKYTIVKDGTYSGTLTINLLGSVNFEGNWSFNDDKTTVTFTPTTSGFSTETYTIMELRTSDMKLKQVDGSDTEITTFVAQ